MEYSFLITNAEAYAFYIAFAIYMSMTVILLSRYLRIVRNKKLEDNLKEKKKRRVYLYTIISLVCCACIHAVLFNMFFGEVSEEPFAEPIKRNSYYFSILITMLFFAVVSWFGMYLKGTSTLPRHQGPVTGV